MAQNNTKKTPQQQLIADIKLRLGGGRVKSELSDEQYDFAVRNALQRYYLRSSNACEESFLVLDIQPEVQSYTLPDEVQEVREIYRRNTGQNGTGASIDPFSLSFTNNIYMAVNPGGLGGGASGTLATYEFGMAYQKLIGRMFGAQIQFIYNSQTKKLFMERKFTAAEPVLIHVYNSKPADVLLQDIYAANWLRDFATAECKQMLATIRGKFSSGLGGPQGTIALDAEALRTEATAEFARLEEEIKAGFDASQGYGFVIG